MIDTAPRPDPDMSAKSLRRRVFEQLEPTARARPGLSAANRLLALLIIVATVVAVLETEPMLTGGNERLFAALELGFGAAFLTEYFVRLWAAAENTACGSGWRARWAFATSVVGIIDLIAALVTVLPFITANASVLRLLRLLRIISLAKLGRLSVAMRQLTTALSSRRYELALAATLSAGVMLVGASALWWAEGDVQPDKFGSIPRALWWAAVTLTTIGYGDVYPITPLGKVLAGLLAITGVGLIALPAGILAAAFSNVVQRGDP